MINLFIFFPLGSEQRRMQKHQAIEAQGKISVSTPVHYPHLTEIDSTTVILKILAIITVVFLIQ